MKMKMKWITVLLLTLVGCSSNEPVSINQQGLEFTCPDGCTCTCSAGSGGVGGSETGGSGGTSGGGGETSAGTSGAGTSGNGGGGAGGSQTGTCNLTAFTTGVWRQTLTQPSNGSGSGIVIDPSNPGHVYVAMSGNSTAKDGVFKSTNCGESWQELGNLRTVQQVRINPTNSQQLYAGSGVGSASTNGFYRSLNGGSTWTWMPDPAGNMTHQHDDVYSIAVDPSDFGHVLVAFHYPGVNSYNASGILESFNGGSSWIEHAPIAAWAGQSGCTVAFLGNSSTWLYGTQGAGFWRTTNSGASWTQVTTRNQTHGGNQVYRTAGGVLYSGSAHAPMRSLDNGVTWAGLTGWPDGYYQGIAGDGTNLYSAKWGGGALQTSGEATGNNPTSGVNIPGGAFELTAVDSVNRIMYMSANEGGVWAVKLP